MGRAIVIKPEVRRFLSRIGRMGGLSRARDRSQSELDSTARRGAVSRWIRQRFGVGSFEDLGLPGWEIVDKGLFDLAAGKTDSIDALAVAEVQPRLRYLGVPVPRTTETIIEARKKLYRIVEVQNGEMAHERFSAILQRVDSFCDALSSRSPGVVLRRVPVRRDRIWCR